MIDPATERCPDIDQVTNAMVDLLPRGRAWRAGGIPGTVMRGFFRACATVIAELEARICALRPEFFCHSHVETADWWLTEYGLPDGCDPFPNVCAKVRADGARGCADWADVAARAGWAIECRLQNTCGAMTDLAMADRAEAGGNWTGPVIEIVVNLAASPAYEGAGQNPAEADCYMADMPIGCGATIAPLVCLLEALIPDHVERIWSPL